MTRDEYNLAVLEAIGCEAEFENDGSPLALAIEQAQAGIAGGNTAQTDAAIDQITKIVSVGGIFPVRVDRRDEYNLAVLGEARACLEDVMDAEAEDGDDEDFDGYDPELGAQIELSAILTGDTDPDVVAQADAAIDHLRGMLIISYCDESDLPPVVRR